MVKRYITGANGDEVRVEVASKVKEPSPYAFVDDTGNSSPPVASQEGLTPSERLALFPPDRIPSRQECGELGIRLKPGKELSAAEWEKIKPLPSIEAWFQQNPGSKLTYAEWKKLTPVPTLLEWSILHPDSECSYDEWGKLRIGANARAWFELRPKGVITRKRVIALAEQNQLILKTEVIDPETKATINSPSFAKVKLAGKVVIALVLSPVIITGGITLGLLIYTGSELIKAGQDYIDNNSLSRCITVIAPTLIASVAAGYCAFAYAALLTGLTLSTGGVALAVFVAVSVTSALVVNLAKRLAERDQYRLLTGLPYSEKTKTEIDSCRKGIEDYGNTFFCSHANAERRSLKKNMNELIVKGYDAYDIVLTELEDTPFQVGQKIF